MMNSYALIGLVVVLFLVVGKAKAATVTDDAYELIADAIEAMEGYYPGTLAWINNNPGNLRYVGQPNATQGQGGFAAFSDYETGRAALIRQIGLYADRGDSIKSMMLKYAPSEDSNDPAKYARFIGDKTGLDINTPLGSL